MKFLVILAVLAPVLAWDTEYAGFIHFHDWDGHVEDLASEPALPSGNQMPSALAKDICAADGSCDTFRLGGASAICRSMNVNATRDIYIANNSAIASAAICEVQMGGGNFPSSYWLFCDGADGFGWGGYDDVIGNFDLPPDVLHQSCLQNPSCTAFSVDNGGARGTLFKKGPGVSSGWFALPATSSSKKLVGARST
jgi:hypothetical protein